VSDQIRAQSGFNIKGDEKFFIIDAKAVYAIVVVQESEYEIYSIKSRYWRFIFIRSQF